MSELSLRGCVMGDLPLYRCVMSGLSLRGCVMGGLPLYRCVMGTVTAWVCVIGGVSHPRGPLRGRCVVSERVSAESRTVAAVSGDNVPLPWPHRLHVGAGPC